MRYLFATLFLLYLRLARRETIGDYLRRKYGVAILQSFRRLESTSRKLKKAKLDEDFLLYCSLNNIVPNFVKFKLYRSSLYDSDFYTAACRSLLDIELRHKAKNISRLETKVSSLCEDFYCNLSFLDKIFVQSLLRKNVCKYAEQVASVHERKLLKLGIRKPKFIQPKDVIFNLSSYILSQREQFLLSLGLDFGLPNFRLSVPKYFLEFEKFFSAVKNLPFHINLESARQIIQSIAHKSYGKYKYPTWFPFFRKHDLDILKKLSNRKDLVICKPDKGRGVVIMNKTDYLDKMNIILRDNAKFREIGVPNATTIFKLEDKINRNIKQWKDNGLITQSTYEDLYCSGSSFGILYGLPKVHKNNAPLRPILAAYNLPNYRIAKFLVPILERLTTNLYSLRNSYQFVPEVITQSAELVMVSFDVTSLFTNIPLVETIEIILSKLFTAGNQMINGFDRQSFKNLLELSVLDTNFIFDGKLFQQIDGMAMGSPLGPTFANIFMCHLEERIFSDCPEEFKPKYYRRFVDDTFALFRNLDEAHMFLNFINSLHPNIQFTVETEQEESLSFLDITVNRTNNRFSTGVYRKSTFTGLGLNFYSYCSFKFKLNSCKTLLHRAYNVCSDWVSFHSEISFLTDYFAKNCYPPSILSHSIKKFLDNVFKPRTTYCTVPKKQVYVSLPYMGNLSMSVEKELNSCLTRLYPYVNFIFIFKNPFILGNLFRFKDTIPKLFHSGIVYKFDCPRCNLGTYIGCSTRMLGVRIASHKGVSHRTGCPLNKKEFSAIREHCRKCKHDIQNDDFSIIAETPNKASLVILESLYIRQFQPSLNNSSSSVPLHVS